MLLPFRRCGMVEKTRTGGHAMDTGLGMTLSKKVRSSQTFVIYRNCYWAGGNEIFSTRVRNTIVSLLIFQ